MKLVHLRVYGNSVIISESILKDNTIIVFTLVKAIGNINLKQKAIIKRK